MNHYVPSELIKKLREAKGLTQLQLAEKINVSDKAVSKWETGRGYPDITLLEPLAGALGISVAELLSGEDIVNRNRACNLRRLCFHVCPVCGNILIGMGESVVSCCGIRLPCLEAEEPDAAHMPQAEPVEDEVFLHFDHEMTKEHFISFIAVVSFDHYQLVKLYPEGNAEARIKCRPMDKIYWYCKRHGLYAAKLPRK